MTRTLSFVKDIYALVQHCQSAAKGSEHWHIIPRSRLLIPLVLLLEYHMRIFPQISSLLIET